MGILLHDFKRLGPHLGAEPASIFSVGLCRFGSCLAGWPDHPRRAVDQKREEPARAQASLRCTACCSGPGLDEAPPCQGSVKAISWRTMHRSRGLACS